MEGPDYAAELKQSADVFNTNRMNSDMFQKLVDMFGKNNLTYDVICNVSKNIKLFKLFQHIPSEKFIKVEDALSAANNAHEKVLIHFTELNLYGLFEHTQYQSLVSQMQERYENDNNISFRPRQIILSGLPQKLVFICLGDETIVEKIRGYVAKKYKCDIKSVRTEDRTEITV